MARTANNSIGRTYTDPVLNKIELKNDIQNVQFKGRLTAGRTYQIENAPKRKRYMTYYNDDTIEIWERTSGRGGVTERTIAWLTKYEIQVILSITCQPIPDLH